MAATKPTKARKPKTPAKKKKAPAKRKGGRPRRKAKRVPRLPKSEAGISAKPVPLDDSLIVLTIDNVDDFKKSNCRYYERCMNHAAKKGWSQFQCRVCKIYVKDNNIDNMQMRIALGRINSGQNEPIY